MRRHSPAISLSFALGCTLGCAACRASDPSHGEPPPAQTAKQTTEQTADRIKGQTAGPTTPASARATQPQSPSEPDSQRADRLRDLDDMCKAVDHDYADGTLRDYYSGLRLRTSWGNALREAGDESTTPGRTLERAAAELAVRMGDPGLEHCAKLFDYLDEVE